MKCINCKKDVEITFPAKIYVHSKSSRITCKDGFGYADPGDDLGKVFGVRGR